MSIIHVLVSQLLLMRFISTFSYYFEQTTAYSSVKLFNTFNHIFRSGTDLISPALILFFFFLFLLFAPNIVRATCSKKLNATSFQIGSGMKSGRYRVFQKTVPLFYFCDNFRKWTPILTIFSPLEPEIYYA